MDSMVSIGILNISVGIAASSSSFIVEDVSIGIAADSDGSGMDTVDTGSGTRVSETFGSITSFSKSGTVTTGSNASGTASGWFDDSAAGATLKAAITSGGTSKSSKNPAGTDAG